MIPAKRIRCPSCLVVENTAATGSEVPVGEESEVADADEAWWQKVEQEAAQELVDGPSHEPLLVATNRVAPPEGYAALRESHQPGVGDGDAMGIGAQMAQHMFRASGSIPVSTEVRFVH